MVRQRKFKISCVSDAATQFFTRCGADYNWRNKYKIGSAALDYFVSALLNLEEREIPQVILLDLNMPVMDGWQFLTELGKYDLPKLKDITLYIVSSSINPADLERSKAVEMVSDFLVKPVNIDNLEALFKSNRSA